MFGAPFTSAYTFIYFFLKSTLLLKGIPSCSLKSEYFNVYIVNGHWKTEKLLLQKISLFLSSNNANNISSHVDHSSSTFSFANANLKTYFILSRTLCHWFRTPKITLPQKTRSAGTSRLEGHIWIYEKNLKDRVKEIQCLFPQRNKRVCTQFLLCFVYL